MLRVEGIGPLPVFLVTDFLAAAFLGLYVGGALARWVGYWYLPMIAFNTAIWAADQGEPLWHYYTLLALAFLQALSGMAKVWGHGEYWRILIIPVTAYGISWLMRLFSLGRTSDEKPERRRRDRNR